MTLDEAAAETRKSVRQLRTLFVDIYPENLHEQGLEVALRDLLNPFAMRGIKTSLDVPADLHLSPGVENLLYRVAKESLRNTATHAHARSVAVRVTPEGGRLALRVRDDGR